MLCVVQSWGTPLREAAARGHAETARYLLLEARADPLVRDVVRVRP
jgi:hypothetical protein